MNMNYWLMLAILVSGLTAFYILCKTKRAGFGRYTTSALVIILVLTSASLLATGDKLSNHSIANILFAVIGFAGGLITHDRINK